MSRHLFNAHVQRYRCNMLGLLAKLVSEIHCQFYLASFKIVNRPACHKVAGFHQISSQFIRGQKKRQEQAYAVLDV